MNFGSLAFITFVVGWTWFVHHYYSYPEVEKRLTKERELDRLKSRSHLKLVERD